MYVDDANNLSQNDGLFKQIVVERDSNARLLGYESHAAYRLKKRLMKTPDRVEEFLTDLETKQMARGRRDMKSLVELKKQNEPENSLDEGFNDDIIFPWDFWYYARMAQQRRHVSQDRVTEYFHLQHIIKVMLEMFSEFLSIQFFPISPDRLKGSIWHEDVHVWAVWEVSHFHAELGHSVHHLVARTNYVAFHGHRSPPDFAEALSVMLEKWCWMEPELKRLGLHYARTHPQLNENWLREHPGEELPPAQIPDDMIQILTQGQQVIRSLWFLRQMVYARFDMAVHHPKSHDELLKMNFTKIYYGLAEKLGFVRAPEPEDQGYPHADLGHLVFGYGLFESTFREDPRNVSAWDRYKKGILEFGGSRDELGLLQEYLGHTPTAEALLRDILE
ncbi:hypothetical protein FVEG_15771 [Fusarium verticillioides 7600]|uniref:Peptidase M3A/M3B catalytic domain-containing protein n=1 Tax=Gibberella moniliformis (strain M3125 / FGSC 7600) TaxID=334819 RepID=W7MBL5_GIBM7|nr:hypothetical protein FVEG_15771 [Fusarium verticillioides 7600]EWG45000.1 hypothetical protein FVEG_15771 [Fusarium verticillioides 7600]